MNPAVYEWEINESCYVWMRNQWIMLCMNRIWMNHVVCEWDIDESCYMRIKYQWIMLYMNE